MRGGFDGRRGWLEDSRDGDIEEDRVRGVVGEGVVDEGVAGESVVGEGVVGEDVVVEGVGGVVEGK